MRIKFLHLNIEWSRFPQKIARFVGENSFDIVNFQEVTGGTLSKSVPDSFEYFKNALNLGGELVKSWATASDNKSYFGNATLFNKSFGLAKKDVIRLKDFSVIPDYENRRFEDDPRTALSLTLKKDSTTFNVINTHLAWGKSPKDEPFKIEQALKLYKYLQTVTNPFILSGDFNLTPDSGIVKMMEEFGRNLTTENHVANTLNTRLHRIQGISHAVDYIFVSKTAKVKSFEVVYEDLSDHYGLMAEIEI